MTRFAPALAVLALALVGTAAADDKAALKELEGTYKFVSAEKGGNALPKEVTDNATVTIKGDELTINFDGDKKVAKIKVGADAKPATIDFSPSDGAEKGKTFPGVYKLEKGELTLAFTEKGDRPKAFKSDENVVVLTLKKSEK